MDRGGVNLLAAIVVVLISIHGNQASLMSKELENELHHIQFVQTWTPTPCGPGGYMKCIHPLPQYYTNNFSMHGLWPAGANGKTLKPDVEGKPVPDEVFQNIEADMNIWWANLNFNQPSHTFWGKEWLTHGITGNWGQDGAEKYFLDGIKLRKNINLLSILTSGGIRLNTNYTKQDIIGVINNRLHVTNLYISCSRQKGGLYYLYEILICLDKVTHAYVTCPADTDQRSCQGEFFQIPHT